MKIITFEDIKKMSISSATCYKWAENMIKNKSQALLPPKISLKPYDGVFCNVMPSVISGVGSHDWEGVKVVTRYPDRIPSLESRILLLDATTGEFLALMDGTWITTMRTGAVAANSICLFAKENFKTIGMMGLGNVTRSTLIILSEILPNREMVVKLLKYKGQEMDFTERFSSFANIRFEFVDTPEQMVKGSDVVISGATYLPNDVCDDKYFDEGVLVQPIHTLGFTNCDLFFDKIYADDIGHVSHFKNYEKFKYVAEVSDVINGKANGREKESDRILVYNIGVSIHDINFAANIYELIRNDSMFDSLAEIDMKDPEEKFWV